MADHTNHQAYLICPGMTWYLMKIGTNHKKDQGVTVFGSLSRAVTSFHCLI